MPGRLPLVLLCSLCLWPTTSRGSSGRAADTAEDLLWMEIPTVLTSTLKESRATDVPSPVYVITSDEIVKRGYYTLKDVVQDIPGFIDVSDANESIVGERGAFASTTNKTLILINGHRMNDLNLGRWNMDQFLGLDAVEKIEFVHGPGSALYGTGALLGVINIITKQGGQIGGTRVKAKIGSFNNELSCTYGAVSDGGTEVMFNVTYTDSKGDAIDQPASRNTVPAGQTATDGKIYLNRYPQNFSAMASLANRNVTFTMRHDHYARALPRCPNGSYYDWSREVWPPTYNEDSFFADLRADLHLSGRAKIVINPSLHYYELKEQSWIGTFGANWLPPYGSRSGQLTEEMHYRLKAYYQGRVGEAVDLTAGYDGIYATWPRSMGWSLTDGAAIALSPRYLEKGELFLHGLFAQAMVDPMNKVSVIAGARYDLFDGQADPAVTPRLGVIVKPSESVVTKVLYATSYLAPQWAHQHMESSPTQAFQSNSALEPEDMRSLDAIANYSSRQFHAWVDVFYNQVDGIITAKTIGGVQQYVNAGQAKYQGAEAGVKAAVLGAVKVDASISYVADAGADAGFVRDNQLNSVPRYVYRVGLEYSPVNSLALLVWGRGYSRVNAYTPAGGNRIEPWASADASVNVSIGNGGLQLKVINVTNGRYYLGDNAGTRLPLPGYERGCNFTANWRF